MPAFKFEFKGLTPDHLYFALAGTILLAISAIQFFDPINIYFYGRDVWHHMAVLNALMDSPFNAVNPHIESDAPSRSFMPWFVMLALLGKTFGLSALQVLGLSAFISMTILLFGLRLFAKEYFQNNWAPLILFFSFIGAWGLEYNYVGNSNIETLAFGAGYPFSIVMSLGFFAWWVVLKFLKNPKGKIWPLAFIFLYAAFAFPAHQLHAGFVFGTIGVLAVFSPEGSLKKGVQVGLAVAGGVLLSSFWFYYNSVEFMLLSFEFPGWETHEEWYTWQFIILTVGLAYLGVLGFYNYKEKSWRWDLVIGFTAIFSGFFIGKFLDISISHRLYAFWVFFLHLGLTGFLLSWPLKFKLKEQIGFLPFLQKIVAVLFVITVSFHVYTGLNYYPVYSGFGNGTSDPPFPGIHPSLPGSIKTISADIEKGDVLMAHDDTAYPAQAYKIKVVSIPRPAPLTPEMGERQQATLKFFREGVTDEERWEIINKYNVTHILYRNDRIDPGVPLILREFGQEMKIDEFLIFIPVDFSKKP